MNTNERPAIVILVGLPASGKSTARAKAVESGASATSYQYSTDDIVDRIAAELGMTYSEVWSDYIKEATAEADVAVRVAIANKQGVLWDQTNMTAKKRGKILNMFGNEWRKECICILPPFTAEQQIELERRLASREGKHIPKFVMANMLKSFMLPGMNEGFNRVLYFDIYGTMIERNQAAELFGKL
jgi:predicted kinase